MSRILIIDDEEGIRNILADVLGDEGYRVEKAADGLEGLEQLRLGRFDLVFLDVWMPGMGGLEMLQKIRDELGDVTVVMMSGHATIDQAVKAMKMGAFDFAEKPLSIDRVLTLARNALKLDELKKENRRLKEGLFLEDEMIGSGPGLRRVRDIITQSGPAEARVMICGENGTGKELVARGLHLASPRAAGPFVEVNCAAIPESLIESELFGHEKGAFTGAVTRRKGKFELAHKGTLFLDEVADMSLSSQAKVLRVLQEQRFERVGGEDTIKVDVRLVCASNKDLAAEVREGRFREDLYFRLAVIPVTVPPLRERLEDLPELIDYFVGKFRSRYAREPLEFSSSAREVLAAYAWPGNIRELKNYLERVSVMCDENPVSAETARYYLGEGRPGAAAGASGGPGGAGAAGEGWLGHFAGLPFNDAKELFERTLLETALTEAGGNLTKAAAALGLYPSNLHAKMKKYQLGSQK